LRERRVDDLGDAVLARGGDHVLLGLPVQEGVLGLRGDDLHESLLARELDGAADLLAVPVRDADVARLARIDDLGEGAERLLHRDVVVVAVCLVQVDLLELQPRERGVDLLQDLLPREAAAAVRRRGIDLRREDVRVARVPGERAAEHLLGAALAVDVRRVEEVDPDLERGLDERRRGVLLDAPSERRPGAEADLRDLEIAVPELPVLHYASVSIWARWRRPE
jgi:hypothetical protein